MGITTELLYGMAIPHLVAGRWSTTYSSAGSMCVPGTLHMVYAAAWLAAHN